MVSYTIGILILAVAAIVIAQLFLNKAKTRKGVTVLGILLLVFGVFAIVSPSTFPALGNQIGGSTLSIGGNTQSTGNGINVNAFQPTATYSAIDKFNIAQQISGTSYYKANANKVTTTAYTNTNVRDSIQYWVDNSTYYTMPKTVTAINGVTPVVLDGYKNGSITITGYDLVQRQSLTNGAYNSSMGANKFANIEFKVIGAAKSSALPFGGVMVVEVNSSIPTVSCSGDGIVGLNTKYHVTYTPTTTSNKFLVYEVAAGYDTSADGNVGVTKTIRCDFTNGATAAGTGAPFVLSFIPADYYVANDGTIQLDVENAANGGTTRNGAGTQAATFYWGA